MHVMTSDSSIPIGNTVSCPSILLASDSEHLGSATHRILEREGFRIQYAGHYSTLAGRHDLGRFDMVLLEVTGEHAVEEAVEMALQVKRASGGQCVAYLAESTLDASGLAGDAVFPRSNAKLPGALRAFFAEEGCGQP